MLVLAINTFSQSENPNLITAVKYVSAENVYLDTGSDSGIQIGDKFTIFRNEKNIGHVEVIYVAKNSASCKILDNTIPFLKNDKAVRTFLSPKEDVVADTTIEKRQRKINTFKRSKKISQSFARLSGSASLQWYQFLDSKDTDLSFSQPSLRLNLKARQLWGKNYNFYLKLRSRYTNKGSRFNNLSSNEKLNNRIYTLGFEYSDDQVPVNFNIGRIISPKFSGIGYFDGAILQFNLSSKFNLGIFAGAQPQWQYSDFQSSLQKYGFYLNYLKGDYRSLRFESTLAAAGEYHNGIISREFVYIQNKLSNSGNWSLYQGMSLDINRDWRKEISGESVSLSNLYLSGRYKFSNSFTAGISYDNRRNYLTFETKSVVEELFDDAQRQGLRTNVSFTLPQKIRLSANFGLRKKQNESETTYSYYTSISKSDLGFKNLRGSLNFSGFSNLYTNGYNPSIRITRYLNDGHSFGLSGGSYFYALNEGNEQRSNNWTGIESYIYLFKSIFLMTNYEYNWGDDSEGHRILAELGYRF